MVRALARLTWIIALRADDPPTKGEIRYVMHKATTLANMKEEGGELARWTAQRNSRREASTLWSNGMLQLYA